LHLTLRCGSARAAGAHQASAAGAASWAAPSGAAAARRPLRGMRPASAERRPCSRRKCARPPHCRG